MLVRVAGAAEFDRVLHKEQWSISAVGTVTGLATKIVTVGHEPVFLARLAAARIVAAETEELGFFKKDSATFSAVRVVT